MDVFNAVSRLPIVSNLMILFVLKRFFQFSLFVVPLVNLYFFPSLSDPLSFFAPNSKLLIHHSYFKILFVY